jgi:hypothetical protein
MAAMSAGRKTILTRSLIEPYRDRTRVTVLHEIARRQVSFAGLTYRRAARKVRETVWGI